MVETMNGADCSLSHTHVYMYTYMSVRVYIYMNFSVVAFKRNNSVSQTNKEKK